MSYISTLHRTEFNTKFRRKVYIERAFPIGVVHPILGVDRKIIVAAKSERHDALISPERVRSSVDAPNIAYQRTAVDR